MAHWQCFVALLCYGIAMLAVGVGSSESARRSLKTIEPAASSDRIASPYAPTAATQLLQAGSATLFVGTIDGRIAALDWRTGQEKWSYATRPSPAHADSPSASIPTSTTESSSTGGEGTHWEGLARQMMFTSSSPAIVPGTDGLIYFNTPAGLARHPLSAADITRHSPFTPPANPHGDDPSAQQQSSSVVYLGQKRTSCHALHPDFGLLKTFTGLHAEDAMMIEDELYLGGIGARDIVHVSRNDYCVAAVDLATGRELWNVTGGEFVIEDYGNVSSDRSGPMRHGGGDYTHFLVSSSTKATLKLIDIRTGEQVWKSRLSAPAIQAFAKGEKLLFFTEEQLLTLSPAKPGQAGASDENGVAAVFVAVYNHTHYALPSKGLREKLALCFRYSAD